MNEFQQEIFEMIQSSPGITAMQIINIFAADMPIDTVKVQTGNALNMLIIKNLIVARSSNKHFAFKSLYAA